MRGTLLFLAVLASTPCAVVATGVNEMAPTLKDNVLTVYHIPILSPYTDRTQVSRLVFQPLEIPVAQFQGWDPHTQSDINRCEEFVRSYGRGMSARGKGIYFSIPTLEMFILLGPEKKVVLDWKVLGKPNIDGARIGWIQQDEKRLDENELQALSTLSSEGHRFRAVKEKPNQRNPEGVLEVPLVSIEDPSQDSPNQNILSSRVFEEARRRRPYDIDVRNSPDVEINIEVKHPGSKATVESIFKMVMESLADGGQAPLILVDARDTEITVSQSFQIVSKLMGTFQKFWNREYLDRLMELRIITKHSDHTFIFIDEKKVVTLP